MTEDKLVGYDIRRHATQVTFAAGEEKFLRLPRVTEGPVQVSAPDQAPREPKPDGRTGSALDPGHPPRPSTDLELELTHPGGVSVTGTLGVTAESLWADNLWRVRIKDKRPPGSPDRDVWLVATYNSTLPIRERSVPAGFYHAGLASNYNEQQYLEVSFDENYIKIGFKEAFRLLYGLDTTGEPDHLFRAIFSEYVKFPPKVHVAGPVFDIGAGPHPNGSGNAVFFSVRADCPAMTVLVQPPVISDRSLDVPAFSIRLKLWLTVFDGRLFYSPIIESELLDLLDMDLTYPDPGSGLTSTKTFNPKKYLTELIEQTLYDAQFPYQNAQDYPSSFGRLLGRWLAGREAPIRGIGYAPGARDNLGTDGIVEPASGDIMIRYVAPHPQPEPSDQPTATLGVGSGTATTGDGSILLFDPPFSDEEPEWDPATLGGLPGRDPVPSHPIDLGPLAQIEHIVVLMQENRSFDHVFGYLSKQKLKPEVDGLLPPDHPDVAKQYNHYKDPYGGEKNFYPGPAAGTAWDPHIPGPCHEHHCVVTQVSDGMGGFVNDWAQRIGTEADPTKAAPAHDPRLQLVMDYHTGDQLPVYHYLQDKFVLCDSWYTSHPGPTWPNRFILLTGELNEDPAGKVEEESPNPLEMPPLETKTLLDYLNDWNVPWRVFEHGYSFPRLYRNFTYDLTNILPFDDREVGFEATARSGKLPPVTLIEPDYIELPPGNDDHAPADMLCGQDLVNRIFRALLASPGWEKTLFVITYDEHGGFYDHKTPPINAVPPLKNNSDVLGPRVPGLVISPLVEPGVVSHELFDHTSIGATILRRFAPNGHVPKVTKRMDGARDFGFLLTRAQPRPSTDYNTDDLPALLVDQYAAEPDRNPCRRTLARDPLAKDPLETDNPREDFHWLLAAVRTATGQAPRVEHRRVPEDKTGLDHPDTNVRLDQPGPHPR